MLGDFHLLHLLTQGGTVTVKSNVVNRLSWNRLECTVLLCDAEGTAFQSWSGLEAWGSNIQTTVSGVGSSKDRDIGQGEKLLCVSEEMAYRVPYLPVTPTSIERKY